MLVQAEYAEADHKDSSLHIFIMIKLGLMIKFTMKELKLVNSRISDTVQKMSLEQNNGTHEY
jgi:hypothetical protein